MSTAAERLEAIRARLEAAAARAGRRPQAVRLIAVSKTRPAADIRALAALGVRDFGESRVQEALDKIHELGDTQLQWHFVGHLQSNKTRHIPGHFQWVHSIDDPGLVQRLSQAAVAGAGPLKLLLQVNVEGDAAKHGLTPQSLYPTVDRLLSQDLPGVELCGLMTIGHRATSDTARRAAFVALRELLEGCRQRFGETFRELSMGMSGDFETAIEEGATLVRVGTALFGERD